MPDELEWRDSTTAFFIGGRQWPFTSPLDLLRFKPLLARPGGCGWAPPCWPCRSSGATRPSTRASRRRTGSSSRMGRAAWETVWGPLLRAKFGDRAEDVSMVWLWSKFTLRRQLEGEEARGEKLGYPRALVGAAAGDAGRAGQRARADRPADPAHRPRQLRLRGRVRRARLVPPRPRPRGVRQARDGALRRRARHRPQRHLPGHGRPPDRRRLPGQADRHRLLRGAVRAARARPAAVAVLLDQHGRPGRRLPRA